MKNDVDTGFVGGPYHGNSFNIPEDTDSYEIASHGHNQTTAHIYTRQGDIFVYDRTEHSDFPKNIIAQ